MSVLLSDEEWAEFQVHLKEKEERKKEQEAKAARTSYRELVDAEIQKAIPALKSLSSSMKETKQSILDNFKTILAMKEELFQVKNDQRSHTFTNSDGTARIIVGYYVNDDYADTVETGIKIVKEFIKSLAGDATSQALVDMVLKLLSRDNDGTLKASRVIQLRRIAEKTGNARFLEGVNIIEEAYQPSKSKTFLQAEYKDENNKWVRIPLSLCDV